MQCINKSSNDFKLLASHYNISPDKLAQITYKYWEENQFEELLPTDTYIQYELGQIPYVDTIKGIKELWNKEYKEGKKYNTLDEAKAAESTALRFFPSEAVVLYKDAEDNYVLSVREPVTDIVESLQKKINSKKLSTQEEEDYIAVIDKIQKEAWNNPKALKQLKRLKASLTQKGYGEALPDVTQFSIAPKSSSSQTFTFNDGTTVKTPFKPNSQQEVALNSMSDFIKSNETSMTLSGYAGTGKTSLMELIAAKMKQEGKRIIFSASTNKAAAVLRDRVRKSGYGAQTLNRVFGIQVAPKEGEQYDANDLIVKVNEDKEIKTGSVVVIDEASMINEENYAILNEIAKDKKLKIIYVGDKGQLAPVNEEKISIVFRDKSRRIATLTKVERTNDNAILKEATDVREGKPLSGESSFNQEGRGVAYINYGDKKTVNDIITKFAPALRENADFFRILAYTNETIAAYNDIVRDALGYLDSTPRVGEPIVGYSNWGYIGGRKNKATYRFVNSESYKVTKVSEPKTVTKKIGDGREIPMQTVIVTLEDSLGDTRDVMLMDIKENEENRRNATILAKEKARLWSLANMSRGPVAAAYRDAANDIENFLFINDDIINPDVKNAKGEHPTLQKKVYDFGYAMTVHKSQGSTFTHVLIDDVDISKAKDKISLDALNKASNVDLEGTSQKDTTVYDNPEMGNVTSGGNFFTPTISKESDERGNLRQQLEYVAVSRATHTATIISNNVKKADSPLNHLSEEKIEEQAEQPTETPAKQLNDDEIWGTVSSWAEPMGERPVVYTPVGKFKQTYIVKDGHIYNKEGNEVFKEDSRDRNKILANLDILEDRAVVVTYRDNNYVINNRKEIINVSAKENGKIMQWGDENGDRRVILSLAADKFRTLLSNREQRLSNIVPQMMDLLRVQGITIHGLEDLKRYLATHPEALGEGVAQSALKEELEMQVIKEQALKDGTFMKAPNGKDTNLIEKQWLQVRTKAFKDWFGDWENDPQNASKVVDENGEPLVVYHSSPYTFTTFSTSEGSIYTSPNKKMTKGYLILSDGWGMNEESLAEEKSLAEEAIYNKYRELGYSPEEAQQKAKQENSYEYKTYSLFVNLKNPKIIDAEGRDWDRIIAPEYLTDGILDEAAELGLDLDDVAAFSTRDIETMELKAKKHDGIIIKNVRDNGASFTRGEFGDDYIAFTPNQVKSATDNIGEFSTENDDIQMAIQNPYIEIENDKEIEVLRHDLFNKFKEKSSYGCVGHTANYWYLCDYFGDSNYKIRAQIQIEGNESLLNAIEINLGNGTFRDADDFIRRVRTLAASQGEYKDGDVNVTITKKANENASLDSKQHKTGNIQGTGNGQSTGDNAGTGLTISTADDWNKDFQFFRTPAGEVYGLTAEGELYFDDTKVSPNVQLHEYTHLWDNAVAQRNPELWKQGVRLFKQTSLWNEVSNEENYGKKWQAQNLSADKMEFLIASEVHSRLVGTQGEALLNRIAKEKGGDNIVAKLKQWMLDFWKELKSTFSTWSKEELDSLTLDDFMKMTVRDLVDNISLREENILQQQAQQANQQSSQSQIEGLSGNTAQYGVQIDINLISNYDKWKTANPTGIVAYRVNKNKFNIPTMAKNGYIGNPFNWQKYGEGIANKMFYDWLTTGNNFGEPLANEEYRQAIINKIMSSPVGTPILYYKEKNAPSHATTIGYLINNKHLLNSNQTTQQQNAFQTSSITFTESTGGYAQRTRENAAWSDITLAFATDFNTAGERLTRNAAGNKYHSMSIANIKGKSDINNPNYINTGNIDGKRWAETQKIKDKFPNGIKLNVAGNGIYTLIKEGITQEDINDYIQGFLFGVRQAGVTISEVRSGGQTGVDEAGIIAAQRLGIPASVNAPKGFVFRGQDGKDIADRAAFEKRFNVDSTTQQSTSTQIKGENISSNGSEFAKKLTNPGNNLQVEYKGKTFRNAEHAYQTWKSGEFDEVAYNSADFKPRGSKPVNKETNYQTMVEIITAKFQQHPELIQGITERGGEAYLKTSTHNVTGDKYWETSGQNKFIEALTEAYNVVKELENTQQQPQGTPVSQIMQDTSVEPTELKVNLPGFQHFESGEAKNKPIEVDAAWKIPILQDLDSLLVKAIQENDQGEQEDIVTKMDNVILAQSEEEYGKELSKEREDELKSMVDYQRRNGQLNALIDNNVGLLASEIRETAEDIVNLISDIVSNIQKDPSKVQEFFPGLKTTLDFAKASRKEIITTVGINNLITHAKENFENLLNDERYNDLTLIEQAELILDNWETMVELASDVFVANEGMRISRNSKEGKYEAQESQYTGYDYDNYTDPQDPDAVREEKDEQEHWQIESRTIDAINSMTEKVRMAIHDCYLLDKDGNPILSKFGVPRRVDKKKTVSQIISWSQGALDFNQMLDKLDKKRISHTWLDQLLGKLGDPSGKETDLQSQFYSVMHRPFQLYGIGKFQKGTYITNILNSHAVLSDIMSALKAQFQINALPLFTKRGINVIALQELKNSYKQLEEIIKKYNINSNNNVVSSSGELTTEDTQKAIEALHKITEKIGYSTSEDTIRDAFNINNLHMMYNNVRNIIDKLEKQSKEDYTGYDPFEYGKTNGIGGYVQKFLGPIVEELEDAGVNAFFEDGKMYQSYVIPSFLTELFDRLGQPEADFQNWMEDFYGKSEWFKRNDEWLNPWMRMFSHKLKDGRSAREVLDHKVQLTFKKHSYMRNMSPDEYALSVWTEYFSTKIDNGEPEYTPTWLRIPIMSNKPSSEFIKFFSDRSANYKGHIVDNMYYFFLQELSRIDTVRKRAAERELKSNKDNAISSFDENGRTFQFMTWLNGYLTDNGKTVNPRMSNLFKNEDGSINTEKNKELKDLLNKKVNAEHSLTVEEDARLATLVKEATRIYMQEKANQMLDSWDKIGLVRAAEKIQNIKEAGRSVRENLENFIWNDIFAANNILQLTVTDKAFYAGADNLQKRLSELHAPGSRGRKDATDYNGIPVSDGYHRAAVLKDFDTFISNIVENINIVFDKLIAAAPEGEKQGLIALKDSLTRPRTYNPDGSVKDKGGRYWNINVADAQGYSSPTSYRKKAFIFGKWSEKAEEIYQRMLKGDFNLADLETIFQPLKPFVYGHLEKHIGTENSPIQTMQVPFQAKNAEYLLVMADALIRGQETGRPNILKAITDIMEDSHFDGRERDTNGNITKEGTYNGKGICTIEFESAIKSGGQGIIDLNQFMEDPDGERKAYNHLKKLLYQDTPSGDGTNYNYDTYVHKLSYDFYALQQEVPAHFREHYQAEPSQMRMNIPSDLAVVNTNGETNYYTWTDRDGTKHKLTAKEMKKAWEDVHAANIEASLNELAKELHLEGTKRERNLALSQILQKEIQGSPRYGIDLIQACQFDFETGELRIPKGDPIQSKRIEQLINSIIKNRVNKQEIAGGPVVQVSNWGLSKQLHIRFNSKQGGMLMTREEFEASRQEGTYEKYREDNQAGIAHFEVLAPASMKAIFENFKNEDGSIDIEAVRKCDPELLKIITGRIPNEDKYSIAHCEIVGFLPAAAGEAIMFPYELTEIDDSDFDVDKRYCQRKVMQIVLDKKRVQDHLFNALVKKFKQEHGKTTYNINRELTEEVSIFLRDPEAADTSKENMKFLYDEYHKFLQEEKPYKTVYPDENTEDARNNQIIGMAWAIMSNEMTASKILNPGGFEIPKKGAYVIAAYRANQGRIPFEELEKKSVKELQKLMGFEKDLAWFDAQVQYYTQNAAGSNLIGVFAVNKVAHATLEGDSILVDIAQLCKGEPFSIAGMMFGGKRDFNGNALMTEEEFNEKKKADGKTGIYAKTTYDEYVALNEDPKMNNLMVLDDTFDIEGNYIGKNIGQGIGASADTAKDPWLALINVNMTTAGVFNTMLRMKMPWDRAALFMSQDVIVRALNEYNKRSLAGENVSFDNLITMQKDALKSRYNFTEDSQIAKEPLTKEELQFGLLDRSNLTEAEQRRRDAIDYKILLAFSKLRSLSTAVREITTITRLNSISAAVGPLVIDNIILEHGLTSFMNSNKPNGTGFYVRNENGTITSCDTDTVLKMHPILKQFSRTVDSRDKLCPSRLMFNDMPAGSIHFKDEILAKLPDNIKEKIYGDRNLLSKLSDFYQSYMLVASGFIDPNKLEVYVNSFPSSFLGTLGNKKIIPLKEQYPDNAFIQAIQPIYDRKTGKVFLNIETTGMLEQEKERLRMGWVDFHKANPKASTYLFNYAFFRGGIGFSPKTWMSLVPTYVKEHLVVERNGESISYVDTYRHFPTDRMVTETLIEQFVRNNWDNNTLAPMKGGEGTHYTVTLNKKTNEGTLMVTDDSDVADLKGVKFMRTIEDKETILWKLVGEEKDNTRSREYRRIMPLGNNGEYIEMSLDANMKPMQETVQVEEEDTPTEYPPISDTEISAVPDRKAINSTKVDIEQLKTLHDLVPVAMKAFKINENIANDLLDLYATNAKEGKLTENQKGQIQRLFKEAGTDLSKEQAAEKYKDFC